ncbi:hypothetical protein QFZ75_001334 [Streptomyces sp. V3I8]|uniref:ABC transporter permease n=1 Tax=Streptomyces sp. V3I8 TaxID=3042279 RepID=UPI002788A08C|nr:hypothetical protein [Streptomyces sp. V3I8]MDQ1034918.1 hypothetical protein [Streptomyces sp. V3I8]
MTGTDPAVDGAGRAREPGGAGGGRRSGPPRGRWRAGRLSPGRLPDELGVLLTTAHNSVYISLMACGMVFALAMREVDLSVGGGYAMCLVVGALLFRGVGLALADGKQITDLPLDDSFFTLAGGDAGGVPFALWVLPAVAGGLTVVLTRTRFGARARAVGSNPDAAAFSGIPVVRTRVEADAQDVLRGRFGVHEGGQERQFGGTGVAEAAVHALAAQDVEQGGGGAAAHRVLLVGTGTGRRSASGSRPHGGKSGVPLSGTPAGAVGGRVRLRRRRSRTARGQRSLNRSPRSAFSTSRAGGANRSP